MKILKVGLLFLMALTVATAPLNAQSPGASPAVSPVASSEPKAEATTTPSATPTATPPQPGDPFVKKQVADLPAKNAAPKEPKPVFNIYFTVEIYALAQADAARLIAGNLSGTARHERILELVKNGKARFETLLSDVTKDGQRSLLEQIDETPYPTNFAEPRVTSEPAFPTSFEKRDVGDTLEYEPTISSDDGRCDMNMVLSLVRLLGFHDYIGQREANGQPVFDTGQPVFSTRKVTTSVTLPIGNVEFLGTLNDHPQLSEAVSKLPKEPEEVRLAFGCVDLIKIAPSESAQDSKERETLEHQLSFYSLPREAAREILAGIQKGGDCYAAVQTLVDRKEARLERITVLKTKSGHRSVVEEVKEVRHATEYKPTQTGTNNSAKQLNGTTPNHFEVRNVGLTLEIETCLGPNSIVDINFVPQLVRLVGDLQMTGIAAKYPAQPVFETRKITTSLTTSLGKQALIGTFNPPGDNGVNGRKDTGRVWLGFIRTTLATP